jgi:S-adenosylmethionine:tRNA ribosyltransferase-isomerase
MAQCYKEMFYCVNFTAMTLLLKDYTYDLPPDRIALYPLKVRDESKLLYYKKGKIDHRKFVDLVDLIPKNSLLFFNDTRVIPARLNFKKDTGATIEIFLLNPVSPSPIMSEAMLAKGSCTWECTIGNLKRWTQGITLVRNIKDGLQLKAELLDKEKSIVRFSWGNSQSFSELITQSGETPLPPYLHRPSEPSDRERYQTVYSHYDGAVAAPTAGLHFTPSVLEALTARGIGYHFLTLHVSAGTFQPVKTEKAEEHTMHDEQLLVKREILMQLLETDRFIIPVGTTSMRTLESLYWYGLKLLNSPGSEFIISQNDPYRKYDSLPSTKESIQAIIDFMDKNKMDIISGNTSIYIMPGYTFRICNGLITNFHQPGSTLLLLIAALIGDAWRKVYREAMDNGYRFLSYGDSSLLIP